MIQQTDIKLVSTHADLLESVRQLARVADPEYRDAESDLQSELYRLGVDADDITVPLDTVLERLVWVAFRSGYFAARQN